MGTTVHPLPLSISNAFLVLSDRPALVDAGPPDTAEALRDGLARHGLRPEDLAVVVLTHGHTDHTGGLGMLAAAGVPVAVGAADADLVRTGRNAALPPTGPAGTLLRPFTRRMVADPVEPDITIDRTLSLQSYGVDADVEVVGGHTPGSCIVRAGDDAVVGDLVRGGFAGGRIRPGHPLRHYFAEDPAGVRRALDSAVTHTGEVRRLLVGHGGPLDAADVRRRLDRVAPLP